MLLIPTRRQPILGTSTILPQAEDSGNFRANQAIPYNSSAPLPFPVPAPWLKTSTSNPETHPTRVPARIKTHRKFSLNREPVSASDSSHQIGSGGLNQYKGKKTSKTQHRHVRCFISLVMASDEVALSPEIHDGTKRLESQLNNAVPIGCRFRSSIGGNN